MHDAPRYQSLRDYLRVVREHRLLIAFCTLLLGGAAVAVSVRAEPVYRAEAALSFQDENADLGELGAAIPLSQTAEQRAALGAERVTGLGIAEEVKDRLNREEPPATLLRAITASPETRTNLVVVQADWGDAAVAADLANAFADATRDRELETARARYRRRARDLRQTLRELPGGRSSQLTESLNRDRIARFENLARFADPVQLAVRARAPSTPVSPKPVRNVVLGLLAGLTLGLIAAFVRDALDRRVRTAEELREDLRLPLLGQVGDDLMGRSVMSHNGRKPITGEQLEPFRILRRNIDFLDVDRRPGVVLVTSGLPEEGKTTVSGALAAVHAFAGRRTLLLECDLRRPTIPARWGIEAEPGIADVLAGDVSWRDAVNEVEVQPGEDGNGAPRKRTLSVLPAGRPTPDPAELLGSQTFRNLLAELRAAFDVVIVDAPPLLPVVDALELVPQVDGIVLCVRASRSTRDEARAAKAALAHFPERPTGLVLTGARRGTDDSGYYAYAYAYGAKR